MYTYMYLATSQCQETHSNLSHTHTYMYRYTLLAHRVAGERVQDIASHIHPGPPPTSQNHLTDQLHRPLSVPGGAGAGTRPQGERAVAVRPHCLSLLPPRVTAASPQLSQSQHKTAVHPLATCSYYHTCRYMLVNMLKDYKTRFHAIPCPLQGVKRYFHASLLL